MTNQNRLNSRYRKTIGRQPWANRPRSRRGRRNDPASAIFEEFSKDPPKNRHAAGLRHDHGYPGILTVELGRTKISIRNLLQLAHGSVVELEGLAGEPMDVLINGTLIAQGEVVVVNEKFGIRLTDIITPQERIRKLNR
jgi:flagellar motor switch protein FliN/FliY